MKSFNGSVRFREKIFNDAVVEKSSISIKQEIIIDSINISGAEDTSDETDSISIDECQVQSSVISITTKSRKSGEDIKAQDTIKNDLNHIFEMDKYIKNSDAEITEVNTE